MGHTLWGGAGATMIRPGSDIETDGVVAMKRRYAGAAFIALGFAFLAYGAISRDASLMGAGTPLLAVGAVLMATGVAAGRRDGRGERPL